MDNFFVDEHEGYVDAIESLKAAVKEELGDEGLVLCEPFIEKLTTAIKTKDLSVLKANTIGWRELK